MTPWILWTLAASCAIAVAACAIDRVLATSLLPRRYAWIIAAMTAVAAPMVMSLRGTPRAVAGMPPSLANIINTPEYTTHSINWSAITIVVDPWLIGAWLVASSIVLVAYARAFLTLHRSRSGWTELSTDGVRILVSNDIGPAVFGFINPRVVVPHWALTLATNERRLLLRHEFEHVYAGDSRTLLVIAGLLIVFPWNFALWYMASRLRLAIEIDCDARVINHTGNAHQYGLMLLTAAQQRLQIQSLRKPQFATFSPSLVERRSTLKARIDAMTGAANRASIGTSTAWIAAAFLVLASVARVPRPLGPLTFTQRTMKTVLTGVVRTDNGFPISGAYVRVNGTPLVAVTNTDGSFALAGVPHRFVELTARHIGFTSHTVARLNDSPRKIEFVLVARVRKLPPVVTIAQAGTP